MRFGEVIKTKRLKRGWTQADLAARTGYDPSVIRRAEQYNTAIKLQTVIDIMDALDMELLYAHIDSPSRRVLSFSSTSEIL